MNIVFDIVDKNAHSHIRSNIQKMEQIAKRNEDLLLWIMWHY